MDQSGESLFDFLYIGDYSPNALFIEIERLCYIVKNANIIDDKTVSFVLTIHAICAANRLQQRVILHRLVEVHDL